jgi:hypothetical protein
MGLAAVVAGAGVVPGSVQVFAPLAGGVGAAPVAAGGGAQTIGM